ncbi:antimicrobial peptide NK-lysin-like [Melanerpes formicivorus]|uniref:antimicrobial peptide NK-lysin-like n=1 Tax=Melanerpes formicivorus TaxID=211600 RepID=UPI00358FCDB5
MAAAFLLVLLAVGVVQAVDPKPCQGDLATWCQDMALARRCHREQECHELWDSLAKQDLAKGDTADGDTADEDVADEDVADEDVADGDVADGDVVAAGKSKKCILCTKILQQLKAMAGKDPDEAAVEAALTKVCRGLGKRLGRVCKRLVRKHREELTEALLGAEQPRAACAAIGFCPA